VGLDKKHCVPCEGGTPPLSDAEEDAYLLQTPDWALERGGTHRLSKTFRFPSYPEGIQFAQAVGSLAETENHHPVLTIKYKRVLVQLSTHAVGGLSENDFIMAAKIDGLAGPERAGAGSTA